MNIEEIARKMLLEEKSSCIIVRNNEIVSDKTGHGVAPLMEVYQNEPDLLKDALVFDKIIGKAAASIVILGGASYAYGGIMSDAAYDYLIELGCKAEYGERIPVIINRAGNGMCPLEQSVMQLNDPGEAYATLLKTISELRKPKQ